MQRLIIHLKKVEKVVVPFKNGTKKKIFNTLNIPFSTKKELNYHLTRYSENIKSYKTSFYN